MSLGELLPEHGPNLARALAGSEGTCAIILSAKIRLVPEPWERVMLVAGFPDGASAADHVPVAMAHLPIACEGLDARLIRDMRTKDLNASDVRYLPPGEDLQREGQGRALARPAGAAGPRAPALSSPRGDEVRRRPAGPRAPRAGL